MKIASGIKNIFLKVTQPQSGESVQEIKFSELQNDKRTTWSSFDFNQAISGSELIDKYFPELTKMKQLRQKIRGRMGSIICG